MATKHKLRFRRIDKQRELKFALESYRQGKSERETLQATGRECNDPAFSAQARRLMQMLQPGFSSSTPAVGAGGGKSVSSRQ